MPKLTIQNHGVIEVAPGKKLVLALREAGIDQLHACGGNAKCTTCKVQFISGEPEQITEAEKNVLAAKQLSGVRLSCQITCDHDMELKVISRLEGSGRVDCGKMPSEELTPPPVWVNR